MATAQPPHLRTDLDRTVFDSTTIRTINQSINANVNPQRNKLSYIICEQNKRSPGKERSIINVNVNVNKRNNSFCPSSHCANQYSICYNLILALVLVPYSTHTVTRFTVLGHFYVVLYVRVLVLARENVQSRCVLFLVQVNSTVFLVVFSLP